MSKTGTHGTLSLGEAKEWTLLGAVESRTGNLVEQAWKHGIHDIERTTYWHHLGLELLRTAGQLGSHRPQYHSL